MFKVFIDGSEGTTGLRIAQRLSNYPGIELLQIATDLRKNPLERKRLLNLSDVCLLCLPDDAAREAVSLIDNPHTRVIDTSTAHRTAPGWTYGFAELDAGQNEKIAASGRIAVPGCHATGFIALAAPLVKAGLIDKDAQVSCHSVTGYSGGGRKMIAQYETKGEGLKSPRQYALTQSHKHLSEMVMYTGLHHPPVFLPIVSNFYAGMLVSLPIFGIDPQKLIDVYLAHYQGFRLVSVLNEKMAQEYNGFVPADALAARDDMQIMVWGNKDRAVAMALFDNLGKGSSGAAIQCLNLMFSNDVTMGLSL